MITQEWKKTNPSFVFPYSLKKGRCWHAVQMERGLFRQLLLWGWENLKSDSCRNLAGSSCRGSEASAGKSPLPETAKLNTYADVKSAVPCINQKSELELRNWWKPERTRRVLQPPFWPNRISVSNRSPTMHIWDVVIPNLSWRNVRLAVGCMVYYDT